MFSSTIIFIFLHTLATPTLTPSSLHCSAARGPLDLDKHTRHKSASPGRYDSYAQVSSHRDYSPDYNSKEPKRSRYPRPDPAAPHCRAKYPEHHLVAEGGWSKHADPYPEHLLPSRGKRGDRYPTYDSREEDTERVVRRKERPPPQSPIERDKAWDRYGDRQHNKDRGRDLDRERHLEKDQMRDREQDLRRAREGGRDRVRSRDRGHSGDRHGERDRWRQKDKDRERVRTRSRERELEEERGFSREWPTQGRASWEEEEDDGERGRRTGGRQRIQSGPEEVFDELRNDKGRGDTREFWDTREGEGPSRKRCHTHPKEETGTTVNPSPGSAGVFVSCAGGAFCCGNLRWRVDLTLKSLMKNRFLL